MLIEVTPDEGCVAVPLSKYERFHTRICRPIGLTDADREDILRFMGSRLGVQYDMRNIFDLARYLLPAPPVPTRWRRRMIALGSGEPTRAICSALIAEAFGRVRYPILPRIERDRGTQGHHPLPPPRDPAHPPLQPLRPGRLRRVALFRDRQADLAEGFNYKGLTWAQDDLEAAGAPGQVSDTRPARPSLPPAAKP